MIRWGILGLGHIAHKFAQDLLTLPNARLVAVASTDQTRADEFAARYDVANAFGTYEGLLRLADLDVVYVATRHVKHHENTLMLLRAGKAVLCEKPFGMNAGQVQEMVDTARTQGVFLMEALWSRFMPALQQAHHWVETGSIGQIVNLRADFGFAAPFDPAGRLFDKQLGGGALLDIGIYPLFLSYLLLGKPASLKASATFGQTGADEQCGMVLTYDSGAVAVLDATLLAKTDCVGIIYGTQGTIRIHSRFHEAKTVTLEQPGHDPKIVSFDRSTNGYTYEAEHVNDCLTAGRTESVLWSLDDSVALMNLLDAVRAEAGIVY
ncbi:MAG: Gfo/Idh/MocA family oxidoreductase [Bacteroidetes bacterium]|nr:Gfo/Idh/MocA family oxidoreductase [Fibrella sp.]